MIVFIIKVKKSEAKKNTVLKATAKSKNRKLNMERDEKRLWLFKMVFCVSKQFRQTRVNLANPIYRI